MTAFLSGVLVLVAGVPITQVLRHHPAEMGLVPDGGPVVTPEIASGVSTPASVDFTATDARSNSSTRNFPINADRIGLRA
jgi:hypothetical protein